MTMVGLWMWLGCAGGTQPTHAPEPQLTPPPIPGMQIATDAACMKDCTQSKMATAVSADLIREQCAKQCSKTTTETLRDGKTQPQPFL